MATQTVRFTGRPGLTPLTADVYVDSTGASFATGVTISESVGIYSFSLTDSEGTYRVCVKLSGSVIDTLFVKTANAAATFDCVIQSRDLLHASQSVLDEMYTNVMGSFPTNFESLGITAGGAIENVVLVATTTTNTDMRGTDGANTATPLDAAATRAAVGMASANLDTQLAGKALETTAQSILSKANVLPASFPTNFASMLINGSGHVSRVTLVDTTTTNTDMRGTDGANTTAPLDAAGTRSAVGIATANLDSQLAAIQSTATNINDTMLIAQGSERAVSVDNSHRVHAAVYEMQANVIDGNSLASSAIVAMGSYQIPQTVPAVGTAPTRDQAIAMMAARGTNAAHVGTVETVYKADGTTPMYTLDLTNDGTYTTAIERAS